MLTLLLLALFVLLVGQRVAERPHVEIGVTGGEELPVVVTPTPAPTPVERAAGRGELRREESGESRGGGGGDDVTVPAVPVSPAPQR